MTETVTLRLVVDDPVPGVAYSLQDAKAGIVGSQVAGDGPLTLEMDVTLRDGGKLGGGFIRREGPVRRFVYIGIGKHAGDPGSGWDRRAKIDVHDIPAELLTPGAVLEVGLPGRGKDGTPACATVRPIRAWRAVG